MLNPDTVAIIKATTPVVGANAEAITKHFYPLMFRDYPKVKSYFNQTHQGESAAQPRALANALVAYATHIDDLGMLAPAVEKIVQKHVSLDIQPDHYEIVGTCLLQSIKAVLGNAASDEVLAAWGEAYWALANILIGEEEKNYQAFEKQDDGWRGQKAFTVVRKEAESEVITSFYLKPADGGSAPYFIAGQYIGLVLQLDGYEHDIRRNYSLSDAANGKYLRISVKREAGGIASNHLHDNVSVGDNLQLLPPAGDFVLNDSDKPLVLITAGVGITPTISMLNTAIKTKRPIVFLHAAINSHHHAFRDHVNQLAEQYSNLTVSYVYSEPTQDCTNADTGHVTEEHVASLLKGQTDVDVYFLGVKPFMQKINQYTQNLGIDQHNVHYEFFGPLEVL